MKRYMMMSSMLSVIAILVIACSSGGGGAASNWTGTKQLGVGASTTEALGIAVDPYGNVYVAGYTTGGLDGNTITGMMDFFLTKYDSFGYKVRTKEMGVALTSTYAFSSAVDSSGNVYVAGATMGGLDGNSLAGAQDFFLTKYDPSGNRIYTKQTGTAGSTVAYGVTVDSSGNVYVTGSTTGGLDGNTLAGTEDFFLTKYDPSGNRIYTKQTGTAGATVAYGVAVDASGNVYVAGSTTGGLDGNTITGLTDFFLTKYDSSGNKVFTKQRGVPFPGSTVAYGVAVDASGNVYVAGSTTGGLDGNTLAGTEDFFLTKYDLSGNRIYTKQTGTAGATGAFGVTVDSSGNVYVAGSTTGGLDGNTLMGLEDFFLTKYDSVGKKVYTKQRGVPFPGSTVAYGVAVDSSGNAYVAGSTTGGLDGNTIMGYTDFFLTKYDSSGNKQ